MLAASTNALIACLRALSNESRRVERRLNDDRISDEDSAELGHYITDLQEALAAAVEAYESKRAHDRALTPADELLAYFARHSGIDQA